MKRTTCKVCKELKDIIKHRPIVDKQQFPICSDECFEIYKEYWKDEKNFPKNVINHSQQIKSHRTGGSRFIENNSSSADTPKRIFTEEDGAM